VVSRGEPGSVEGTPQHFAEVGTDRRFEQRQARGLDEEVRPRVTHVLIEDAERVARSVEGDAVLGEHVLGARRGELDDDVRGRVDELLPARRDILDRLVVRLGRRGRRRAVKLRPVQRLVVVGRHQDPRS
jgi:hypothetical protein